MIPLQTLEQFEGLLKSTDEISIVVYFTAPWCGACTRLDFDIITKANPNIIWYKCNVDENKYTLGYCGLQKIPSFAFIKNGKFLGKFTSSDTGLVVDMVNEYFSV